MPQCLHDSGQEGQGRQIQVLDPDGIGDGPRQSTEGKGRLPRSCGEQTNQKLQEDYLCSQDPEEVKQNAKGGQEILEPEDLQKKIHNLEKLPGSGGVTAACTQLKIISSPGGSTKLKDNLLPWGRGRRVYQEGTERYPVTAKLLPIVNSSQN